MSDKRKEFSVIDLSLSFCGNEEKNIEPPDYKPFFKFDEALERLKKTQAAEYGIERCLYELNPELTCLSPYLIHAAVLTPVEALLALDEIARQPDRPESPIDHHLVAFLMSRWKGLSYADLRDLGKPQREVKNLAILRILASVQVYFKVKGLPGLCRWMSELCAPIVSQYRNLTTRSSMNRHIAKAIAAGQLNGLVEVFANQHGLLADDEEFKAAKVEIWLIESEIKEIEEKILNRNEGASNSHRTLWEKMSLFWGDVMKERFIKQGRLRISHLYQRWGSLRKIWGNALLQQSEPTSRVFWSHVWTKMQEPESFPSAKKPVDAPLKYD